MSDKYRASRKYRYLIAALLEAGKTPEQAEDTVMKGLSNGAKYLKNREPGLFPYGEVGPPVWIDSTT